jgi:hypothetical protein
MIVQRMVIAESTAGVATCHTLAIRHRRLAEEDKPRWAAHIGWAEAYEARAGKPASEAQPGDPCGLIELKGSDLPLASICDGTLQCYVDVLGAVPDCSCHLSPPCGACLDAPLVCDTCKETVP